MSGFVNITIGDLVRQTAEKHPDTTALVFPESGVKATYAQFLDTVEATAKGLMALGVKRGDNVSVWTANLPEWLYLQFGLSMIGAVLVTVNTNYKSHELEYILGHSDSTTLVLMEGYRDTNYYDTARSVIKGLDASRPGETNSKNLPMLKNIVYIGTRDRTPGMFSFDEVIQLGQKIPDEALRERERSLDVHDTVNMQYTSGTTGFPKGVMLTHYNIVNNARMVGDVMGLGNDDRLLIHVPFFHCFGCVMSSLNSVYHGSTMVVLESFDPLKALAAVHEERCTAINGVPTMFIAMLAHPDFDRYDMSSLRTGIMAGAPCPVDTMNHVRERMHCSEIVIAFGQTESAPVMTMTRRDDPVELRVSTVGRLLPDIEGKIVDPDTGEDLPAHTQGEIVTRSDCVMKGYYKMEEATRSAIDAAGWLHTGDLGEVDENGYFRVTGRMKDMIIRGGENIYPREIEEFLLTNAKVLDVQVVGVPDNKYGEQVLAALQLREGATATVDEFIAFCTGKIARHKVPRYWEFVKEFPMTASGKIQKYKLREMFTQKIGA
ncbi:MAG: AMP-binding protein [Spirochaetes bacterium]|nr:AMP-binding protein [Spirochaetota bacterium]